MYPGGARVVGFPNQLVKGAVFHDIEEVFSASFGRGQVNVCSLSAQVLRVRGSAHYGVDPCVSQSAGDAYGFLKVIAQRLQYHGAEVCQIEGVFQRRAYLGAQALCCFGAKEFVQLEVACKFHSEERLEIREDGRGYERRSD